MVFISIVGMIACLTIGGLFWRRSRILAKKQRQYARLLKLALTHLDGNEEASSTAVFGGGAALGTIFDLYSTMDRQDQFLEVMAQRFPHEMDNLTPLEVLQKLHGLNADGEQAVQTYVSNYAGQKAELEAVSMLEAEDGVDAELFPSRTHANDDVYAISPDGTRTDYSVKSYDDVGNFKRTVAEHPDSKHYIVNRDLYEKLQDKQLLAHYEANGIEIVDGGYDNVALRAEGQAAVDDFLEVGDVASKIPFVGLALLGLKSVRHVQSFRKGRWSKGELKGHLLVDSAGVAVRTGGAWAGAKVGALIGTLFGPGVGTIVGGGIGAVLGGIIGGSLIDTVKNWFLWGDILKAQLEVGRVYFARLSSSMRSSLRARMLRADEIRRLLGDARGRAARYEATAKPAADVAVTLPAVLSYMHARNLAAYTERVEQAAQQTERELPVLCTQMAEKMVGSKHVHKVTETAHRLLGELILQARTFSDDAALRTQFDKLIYAYHKQLAKHPNDPIRLGRPADEIVQGLAIRSLLQTPLVPFDHDSPFAERLKTTRVILYLSLAGVLLFVVAWLWMSFER